MRRRAITGLLIGTLAVGGWVANDTANAAVARCHGETATIVGSNHFDHLQGTAGRDVIAALGGDDIVDAGAGNDLICGGGGADRLNGDAGRDVFYGGKDALYDDEGELDRVGDSLRGGPGDDTFHPGVDTRGAYEVVPDALLYDTTPRPIHANIAKGVVTGDGHDTFPAHGIAILGSRFADVILGGPEADYLNGGQGPDVLRGRGGDDRVIGDSGSHNKRADDLLVGGRGNDDMSAEQGEDIFRGGPGDDVMDDIGHSADVMRGGTGMDLIIGELWETDASQVFDGGPGTDHLSLLSSELNPNPDPATGTWNMTTGVMQFTLHVPVDITAAGFEKADFATWGATWTVDGTDGPDAIFSGGSTTFYGHAGDDTFMGSPDPDTFDGGEGTDHSLAMGVNPGDTCISVEVFDYDDCDSVTV